MTASTAPQQQSKTASEIKNAACDFTGKLDTGEVLTGTPTVVEVGTSDLTLSNKVVSTAVLTILGRSVAIGKAVQFSVEGGTAGRSYEILITVDTDSSPAQRLTAKLPLEVKPD